MANVTTKRKRMIAYNPSPPPTLRGYFKFIYFRCKHFSKYWASPVHRHRYQSTTISFFFYFSFNVLISHHLSIFQQSPIFKVAPEISSPSPGSHSYSATQSLLLAELDCHLLQPLPSLLSLLSMLLLAPTLVQVPSGPYFLWHPGNRHRCLYPAIRLLYFWRGDPYLLLLHRRLPRHLWPRLHLCFVYHFLEVHPRSG